MEKPSTDSFVDMNKKGEDGINNNNTQDAFSVNSLVRRSLF